MTLFSPLHVGCPLGFAPEAALEDLGLPQLGPGVEAVQLLGSQGFWQHQGLKGVDGQGSRKHSALEGYGNRYWPIRSSVLAWRTPTEKLSRPWSIWWQSAGHNQSDPVHVSARLLACGGSAPLRVEYEGAAAAWLVGTLVVPRDQGHQLPPPQELCPVRVLSGASCRRSEGLSGHSSL